MDRAQNKLDNFYKELIDEIDETIDSFAESNYDNSNASNAWESRVKRLGLQLKCEKLLRDFADECEYKLRGLSKELAQDNIGFSFSGGVNANVYLSDLTDFRGGLQKIGAISAFIPGVGWGVTAAIGLASFLFEDKAKKRRDAIRNMKNQL